MLSISGKNNKTFSSLCLPPKKELLFLPLPRPPTGNVRIPNDRRRGGGEGNNCAERVQVLAHHF